MKKLLTVILILIAILAIGIIGQSDYEYETFEATHSPVTRMPYWYE